MAGCALDPGVVERQRNARPPSSDSTSTRNSGRLYKTRSCSLGSACVESLSKKPRWPVLIPKNGTRRRQYWRMARSMVPSPPMTTISSGSSSLCAESLSATARAWELRSSATTM